MLPINSLCCSSRVNGASEPDVTSTKGAKGSSAGPEWRRSKTLQAADGRKHGGKSVAVLILW